MASTTAARASRTPAGVWTLARAIRNRWAWWWHRYITSESEGFEIRIGPDPCQDRPLEEPTHFHATPATITIEGDEIYAEWQQEESPALEYEWSQYEPWWPRNYSLN